MTDPREQAAGDPFLVVLGIAQDGGYPQAGCDQACCAPAWTDPQRRRCVTSLAVVDPRSGQRWLFDCTPDCPQQLHELDGVAPAVSPRVIDGVFLTHAHVGHYTGLIHLGREVMAAGCVPVYAMPRMSEFLQSNAPWNQLIQSRHIEIHPLSEGEKVRLTHEISVTPLIVPHRAELSETVAFRIDGPRRSALYLPDVDGWDRWSRSIESLLNETDVAYLDGTFYSEDELPGRDMSEIPHPTITESLRRFAALSTVQREKVRFLHLNHSNPALDEDSPASRRIRQAGHHVAKQGERFNLCY